MRVCVSPFRLAVASAFAQTEVEATGRRMGRALLLSPSGGQAASCVSLQSVPFFNMAHIARIR